MEAAAAGVSQLAKLSNRVNGTVRVLVDTEPKYNISKKGERANPVAFP
jgi:hypothetical protein